MDAESILIFGRCNPISSLSFGNAIERILSFLFPPKLKPLDQEAMVNVLEYQYRISRRGIERNPTAYAGVRIVSVTEGYVPPKPERGTALSRTAQRG
jgi:hypothetical protein